MAVSIINIAEKCLLLAVRDWLRLKLSLDDSSCNIERDEMAFAVTGDEYLAVVGRGFQPAELHGNEGAKSDLEFSVSVMVLRRITQVPRDRQRDTYIMNSGSLAELSGDVFTWLDWSYDVVNAASTAISDAVGTTQKYFIHPLVFAGMDPEPQVVGDDIFGGKNKEINAGMKRTIRFARARFTAAKT